MPSQGTGNGGRNGGGRGKFRQANKQLSDNLREACPPHKLDDLEVLIKELKGDEEKIRQRISEWWDEPVTQPTEGEWENVNKKGTVVKKKDFKQQPRGGRGDGRGRGRGGALGGREGRGRGDPSRSDHRKEQKSSGNKSDSHNGRLHGTPPVESVRVPQGAWAKKSEPAAPPIDVVHTLEASSEGDGTSPDVTAPVPVLSKPTTAGPAGNVWATKGSAHLIRAEKPIPPPPPPAAPTVPAIAPPATRAPVAPISRTITKERSPQEAPIQIATPQSPPPELVSGIHATSLVEQENVVPFSSPPKESQPILETGTSKTWSSGTAVADAAQPTIESPASPVLNKTVGSGPISVAPPSIASLPIPTVPEVTAPEPSAPIPKPQEPKLAAPTSFINMGHWENEDNDDTNLDFGFGTFDLPPTNEATTSAVNTANASPSTAPETSHTTNQPSAASASPARPPPGLTIGGGGMPPIPPNAVLVHELENKLEQVSLDTGAKQSNVAPEKQIAGIQPQNPNPVSQDLPGQVPGIHNPYSSTSQYGAMGVSYNYGGPATSAVNAFVGMPGPGAPVLGTPQQPPQTKPPQPTGGPLPQPGGSGLYGTPHSGQSTSSVTGNTVVGGSSDAAPPTSAGIPPGMPNPGMPYGNVYYGQQPPFHMGHNQGGIGYNYYGTQFGGVQGFGYPQNLGQNSGYGHGPYHDDPVVAGSHTHQPQASGGGYQQQPKNNSGVYRGGRSNHSHHANNNQYQQSHQYNPQQHLQGGYGGQPYGMGYHGDHFSQRGGYGGMQDPYGMQPQQPQGAGTYGFQSDDQYKGKSKGGRGGGLQHFQQVQVPPQQLSGQQGFGLQGQGASESNQTSGGGWSNQHSNSGWNTGAASWQQK